LHRAGGDAEIGNWRLSEPRESSYLCGVGGHDGTQSGNGLEGSEEGESGGGGCGGGDEGGDAQGVEGDTGAPIMY
jgi:hypothetical protein